MSKYFWQRGDSKALYIYTAKQLSKELKNSFANGNRKKFTFYGFQDISRYSSELCRLCHHINRLNPDNRVEAPKRLLLVKEARGLLDEIVSMFEIACELVTFSDGTLQKISDLMEKEDRLLAGLQKSDAERVKRYL